jgi:hypothetical protein
MNKQVLLLCAALVAASGMVCAEDRGNERNAAALEGFPEGAAGGTHVQGWVQHGASSAPSPLVDHGGLILPNANFYFLWWGSWGSSANTQSLLQYFVRNLAPISLYQMMTQYERSANPPL